MWRYFDDKGRENMAIRLLKIILVFFVGLQGFLYAAGNVATEITRTVSVDKVLGVDDMSLLKNVLNSPKR